MTYPSAFPHRSTPTRWYRNINLFSITYASQPRLRDRLTLRGLPLLRNPEVYGVLFSHQHYRYSCLHDLFHFVQASSRSPFTLRWNAPLPPIPTNRNRTVASVMCLSPVTLSARNHLTSELLRTLSRVAASKPTSWLSGTTHFLHHLAEIWGP